MTSSSQQSYSSSSIRSTTSDDVGRRRAERRVAIRKKPKGLVIKSESQPDDTITRMHRLSVSSQNLTRASSLGEQVAFPALVSTSLDKKTDFLLRSFTSAHLGRIYWNDAQAADHNKYVVPLAFQKPALFNAMMAKSLTDFQTAGGALPADRVPNGTDREQSLMIDFAFFKMQSLRNLRATIDAKTDGHACPSVIMTIIFLLKMELLGGSINDARFHMRAMQKLLKGGRVLDTFSASAKSPSLFTLNLASLVCQEAPFMVPVSYASTTMSEEVMRALNSCNITHLSSLARGFSTPTMMKLLGPQILCYLPWQRNFVMMRELAARGHLRKMTVEDYGIASSMVHRADYHLLTLPYLTELSSLAKLVRLILLISDVATFVGLPPGTTFVSCLAVQLKDAMIAMDLMQMEDFEVEIDRLVLWACFYGLELSAGLEAEWWFLSRLKQSLNILNFHKPVDAFEVLVNFMYTQRQFVKMSPKVWTEAGSGGLNREASDVSDFWSPDGSDRSSPLRRTVSE